MLSSSNDSAFLGVHKLLSSNMRKKGQEFWLEKSGNTERDFQLYIWPYPSHLMWTFKVLVLFLLKLLIKDQRSFTPKSCFWRKTE